MVRHGGLKIPCQVTLACGFDSHPRYLIMQSPYGPVGAPPQDFAPPEMWEEYVAVTDPVDICAREEVGAAPAGVRWSLWPFTFEEYYGDREPNVDAARGGALARTRLVQWKRLVRHDAPPGWWQPRSSTWRLDGALALDGSDYRTRWDKEARHDLRFFEQHQAAGRVRIQPVSIQEFDAAYRASLTAKRAGAYRLDELRKKLAHPRSRPHVELWGALDAQGAITAGTAILYSPSRQSSMHFAPFIHAAARETFAATGLMDHWFAQTQRRGYRYAVTCEFWRPGLPKSWKGFSEFKSRFGFSLIQYPPVLYKLVGGKLF